MREGDAPGENDVLAGLVLELADLLDGSPRRIVVWSHSGSSSVDDTTYFSTRLR
jgi:hypothetical protein